MLIRTPSGGEPDQGARLGCSGNLAILKAHFPLADNGVFGGLGSKS
ncbi:MAG: hypothetical protein IT513_14290 [Burkholderiales bacterium]|nr:hypothetical protein [Burkholderiales bacterium]